VGEDGYLWLINYTGTTTTPGEEKVEEQQPLLLHSAAAVLQQLQEPWHPNVKFSPTGEEEEEEDAANDEEDEKEEAEREEDPEDEDKNNAREEKDNKVDKVDAGKANTTAAADSNNNKYKDLIRTSNLSDKLLVALTHLRLFKHDTRKKKKRNRQGESNGNNRRRDRAAEKVKALQHQQERLMQQQQQQQQKAAAADQKQQGEGPGREGDVGEFQIVGKPNNNKSNENDNHNDDDDDDDSIASAMLTPEHPYVRLVRTLNSVRALIPVVQAILRHPDAHSTIPVGKKKVTLKSNKKKQAPQWLLGKQVFDMSSVSSCHALQIQVQRVLESFLPLPVAASVYEPLEPPPSQEEKEEGVEHKNDSENSNLHDKDPSSANREEEEERFWKNQWLCHAWMPPDADTSITMPSPFEILKDYQKEDEEENSAEKQPASVPANKKGGSIQDNCRACDAKFFPSASSNGNIQKQDKKAATDKNQYDQAVRSLHRRLSHLLERDFPGARLSVYGSCLSNLSLKASDVDLSLWLPQADHAKKSFQNGNWPPEKYEREMTKLVRDVWRKLMYRKSEFADMICVTRARVPVVKGCYLKANNPHTADGSLQ